MWTLIAPPIGQILNFFFGHKNPILWQVLWCKRTLKRKFVKFVIFLMRYFKKIHFLFSCFPFFFLFWKCIMTIIILIYHFICKAHRNVTIHRNKFTKSNTHYWVIDYYDILFIIIPSQIMKAITSFLRSRIKIVSCLISLTDYLLFIIIIFLNHSLHLKVKTDSILTPPIDFLLFFTKMLSNHSLRLKVKIR